MITKFLLIALVSLCTVHITKAQEPASQEKIAAFKQALQQSKDKLKRYEWIETTTVLLKGDVKSQKQSRCYYGVDGKLQKVEISATQPTQPSGGRLKRRIIAKKKEEMTEYMNNAVALIHRYVPPEMAMIQDAKDSGRATTGAMEPGKIIQVNLSDLLLPGDLMSATVDIRENAIMDLRVSTWLESRQDGLLLDVIFSSLPDGTRYIGQTTLDAKNKDIKIVVTNTGHRKVN